MPTTRARNSPIHYAWVVAGVTFLTLMAAAGGRAAPSVMLLPVGNEFQWSRATVSSIVSLNIFLYGIVGPFAAALYQTIGLRRSTMLAITLIGLGYGLSTLAANFTQFLLLWGLVVGVGSGMAATVLGAAVANRWFVERRGLVVGLLTASAATGQLVFLPWFASVVTTHGWRGAPLIITGLMALMLPIVWFAMRDRPEDVGLHAYGAKSGSAEEEGLAKPTGGKNPAVKALNVLGEAMRHRDFWLLAGSFFICGASTNGLIGTHLVSAAFDCGIPEVSSATLLAMMGIFDLIGTTASGWLSDRCNGRYLLFGYYGLRGLSLLYLPHALTGPSAALTLFAMFYGLDWVATVPPTVRLCADVFGREKASIVFGWVGAMHQVGAAFAAFGAGWLRTTTGTYTLAFFSAGALCLVAALGVLPIGKWRASPAMPEAL